MSAASLTALGNGVAVTSQPWTVRELAHLLAGQSSHRCDADPLADRVTLLTLFRAMAGSNATFQAVRPSVAPRLDAAGDADLKGG